MWYAPEIKKIVKHMRLVGQVGESFVIQLNPCNSNFCNSKNHLNRTNSSVPSKFTSKALQEKCFNWNSQN